MGCGSRASGDDDGGSATRRALTFLRETRRRPGTDDQTAPVPTNFFNRRSDGSTCSLTDAASAATRQCDIDRGTKQNERRW